MSNFRVEKDKDGTDVIVIPIDMNSTAVSGSGKSVMLASSRGFQKGKIGDQEIGISFNVTKAVEE